MRFCRIIAVASLALMYALATAHAEKRVALVVGNARYAYADMLGNPVNDAQGMRDVLKKLGFNVIYGEDLDGQRLRERIGQFAEAVKDADVALVYFAGHGATFSETPYVVPVDATFKSLERVPYELIPVETLIGELRRAKGIRIAILDACRDNAAERDLKRQAVAGRGAGEATRGLAPMKNADGMNPEGLILAYATQYRSTAADDAGAALSSSSSRHSPFTAALLKNIASPGLDVKEMFYKVGRDVIAATEGKQRPEISISIYDQYALVPEKTDAPATVSPPGAGSQPDEVAWSVLKDTRDAERLRRFIAQFPASPRRREAEERIRALEQTNVAAALPVRPAETLPSPKPPTTASLTPAPGVGTLVPQKAVLYEEDTSNPTGVQFAGGAIWRTERITSAPGQKPELVIRCDIDIPEQKLFVHLSLRRNEDKELPASHTVEVTFKQPPNFRHGGVANIPGIMMKGNETDRGIALNGVAVKVVVDFFMVGLSAVPGETARNVQLLKERAWFDIPIVYTDGKRALLAIEKGPSGERAFTEAFAAWEHEAAVAPSAPTAR